MKILIIVTLFLSLSHSSKAICQDCEGKQIKYIWYSQTQEKAMNAECSLYYQSCTSYAVHRVTEAQSVYTDIRGLYPDAQYRGRAVYLKCE